MKRLVVPLATLALFALPSTADAAKPPPKTISFSAASFYANETDVSALVTLTRSWSTGNASVRFSTSRASAAPGSDYVEVTNRLVTFTKGQTSVNTTVTLIDDGVYDEVAGRILNLALSSPSKGSSLGSQPNATLHIADTDPPATPVLSAVTGTDDGEIDLSWNDMLGANDFTVYRGTVSGTYPTSLGNTGGAITLTDTGLVNGTTYYYVVQSVGDYGSSSNSNEASAVAAGTPPVPTELIDNGDFETGDFTSWTTGTRDTDPYVCGTNSDEDCGPVPDSPVISTATSNGGTYSAYLGNPGSFPSIEPCGDSYFSQAFTVPATGTTTLSFWHQDATSDTVSYDQIHVFLMDTDTDTDVYDPLYVADTTAWTETTADLTIFAGQNLELFFLVHQDCASDPTSAYIDDVSVTNTA